RCASATPQLFSWGYLLARVDSALAHQQCSLPEWDANSVSVTELVLGIERAAPPLFDRAAVAAED
ncbi:MAG: hypothetical protein LC775_05035, partial [Acidobacteria bacterium]|nr:hypothetical protein [Acidobacteriota bacterium]